MATAQSRSEVQKKNITPDLADIPLRENQLSELRWAQVDANAMGFLSDALNVKVAKCLWREIWVKLLDLFELLSLPGFL